MTLDFNPYDPDFRRDPHPTWRALRTGDPVHRSSLGAWVLTRHRDVMALSRSRSTASSRPPLDRYGVGADEPIARTNDNIMLYLDGPAHARLRGLVQQAFTPKRITWLTGPTEARIGRLLDRARRRRTFDVVADIGRRLSVEVVADLLGLPEADGMRAWAWTRELSRAFDPLSFTPQRVTSWNRVLTAFGEWLQPLAEARRHDPQDDLISALVQAEDQGERLTADELATTCIFLFTAGHETTVFALSNALHLSAEHPEAWEHLSSDADGVPGFVEEALRLEGPVQFSTRLLTAPVELDGQVLPAGDRVILGYSAASRDPEVYTDPDTWKTDRAERNHLAFGFGPHFCLGAALARLEVGLAIRALLHEPHFRLLPYEPEWVEDVSLRGLARLPATLRP